MNVETARAHLLEQLAKATTDSEAALVERKLQILDQQK